MVDLKKSHIRWIKEFMAYPRGNGYVLNFSDATIAEFFEDEFQIDFDDSKYHGQGSSKCNRLIALLLAEDAHIGAKVLRALWDRREGLIRKAGIAPDGGSVDELKQKFLDVIAVLEGASELPRTDALERYERDRTLDELISDIERDLQANKPEAAMDHLHTYCVKKITHLLKVRGIVCEKDEALQARFGKYRKELLREQNLSDFTNQALKATISLFTSYNDIRNNRSFAHDNKILKPAEARFIFETISAILVFLRTIETGRYD